MATDTAARLHVRLQECLLTLARLHALPLVETRPASDVYSFRFRVGGNAVELQLDRTVLELRAYHERDVITTGRVREEVMNGLLGQRDGARAPRRAELDALRSAVTEWKERNARIFISSPDVARHPDGRNHA